MELIPEDNNLIQSKMTQNKHYTLHCPQKRLIENVCVQPKCNKTGLHCIHEQCNHCHGLHPFCKTISINFFINFLTDNQNRNLQLWKLAQKIETQIVNNLQKSKEELRKQIQYIGLPNSIKSVLIRVFSEQNCNNLTGMDFQSLQEEIIRFRPIDKHKMIMDSALNIKNNIDNYLTQKNQILTSLEANQKIISKILTKQEDINFVFDSLGQPKKLELLYRGSQNHFSAAKFHEKCDEIQHTITIIKTEFDRIIGGYTPLKWSSPSTWTAFSDNSNRSFLLQINLKQKIPITESLYSIYCHQMFGPRFGRADLTLPNKCNQNNCTGNFPTSYNIIGKYKNDQHSYTSFSGTPSGFYFRTIEYEVFKIIF